MTQSTDLDEYLASDEDIEHAEQLVLAPIHARISEDEARWEKLQAEFLTEMKAKYKDPAPEPYEIETVDWSEPEPPVVTAKPVAASSRLATRPLEGTGRDPVFSWLRAVNRHFSTRPGPRAFAGVLVEYFKTAPYESFIGLDRVATDYGLNRQALYGFRKQLVEAGFMRIRDGRKGRSGTMTLTLPE